MGLRADHYTHYLTRMQAKHGANLDVRNLADQFKPYYGTTIRVKVRTLFGEIATGTIAASTGWKPVFLLLPRRNSWGSSFTLHDSDTILAIKVGKVYKPVAQE